MGTASHIRSASPRGPRGSGGHDHAFLTSAENGIWLCANHGRLVDANEGGAYPADVLVRWRKLREARAEREMGGARRPVFWVEGLTVIRSGLIRPSSILKLGHATLLIGKSASGKTAMANWLAGTQEVALVQRWGDWVRPLEYEVSYYDPDPHRMHVLAERGGRPVYEYDGKRVSGPIAGLRVVACNFRDVRHTVDGRELSLAMALGEGLGIAEEAVRGLAVEVGRRPGTWMRNLEWVSDGDELLLDIDDLAGSTRHRATYRSLSGGERDLVLLELAVERAATHGVHEPTLLLVDGPDFDDGWLRAITVRLGAPEHAFQTLLLTSNRGLRRCAQDDWLIHELVDTSPSGKFTWPRGVEVR
jgi:hypothetical protein